ncbi:MAG: trypsin-like peptidase domain-containing protein [Deltaproteobacteria bacterium]|nr:trypsin-like peptidase domain-containing protein [Deltaproteobacteria bacterium]
MKPGRVFLTAAVLLTAVSGLLLPPQVAEPQSMPLWREGDGGDINPDLERLSGAFVRLADKVRPGVAQLRVSLNPSAGQDGESQRPASSRGSGFIIHPEGYILTANHVVEGGKEVEIRLADRQRFRGQVIGADPEVDIALVKTKSPRELPALALGNADNARVGDLVGSLGYPFGAESSLSLGIISRRGRTFNAGFDFIQTNAGASAGWSGGPLVNVRGHVVGMITMASERGNMGFAVPINVIKGMIPRLLRGEKIVWGWLGVRVSELSVEGAEVIRLSPVRGVLVSAVLPGQPAEKSGIHSHDVILAVNGTRVDNPRELIRIIAGIEAGKEVSLAIFRKGETFKLSVRLGQKPKSPERQEG